MWTRHLKLLFIFLAGSLIIFANALNDGEGSYTAAQKPEQGKLFVQVGQARADLTPQQQESLAQLQKQPTTVATRLVRVQTQLLTASPYRLKINLGSEFEVVTTETKPKDEGETWIGRPLTPSDSAVFVVKGTSVTGTIRVGSELYAIRPLGGGLHAVVLQDEKKFPPEHPPEFNQLEKEPSKTFEKSLLADVPDIPRTLRILVAYTPRVAAAVQDINATIDLAISETNDGYERSGVKLRAELAYAYQVNYQESNSHDTDLANFRTPNDSIMDEVHALRDTYKADVCVLLIDNGSYCGTASAILADESSAFVVVHYTCATGYYSFAHEIGHLQGARHNLEADPSTTPFAYGHGYYGLAGKWRTIMSYDCPGGGCKRLPNWSTPSVNYNGSPMGRDDCCNNARVLNETAPVITAFRN